MVHMVSNFIILATLVASGFSYSVPQKRDYNTVIADLNTISTKVTALDTSITNFPATGGSVAALLVRISLVY